MGTHGIKLTKQDVFLLQINELVNKETIT